MTKYVHIEQGEGAIISRAKERPGPLSSNIIHTYFVNQQKSEVSQCEYVQAISKYA